MFMIIVMCLDFCLEESFVKDRKLQTFNACGKNILLTFLMDSKPKMPQLHLFYMVE